MEVKIERYIKVTFSEKSNIDKIKAIIDELISKGEIYSLCNQNEVIIPENRSDIVRLFLSKGVNISFSDSNKDLPNKELLYLEILRLNQMLEIVIKDLCDITGENVKDYWHDLASRDYFEEVEVNKQNKS